MWLLIHKPLTRPAFQSLHHRGLFRVVSILQNNFVWTFIVLHMFGKILMRALILNISVLKAIRNYFVKDRVRQYFQWIIDRTFKKAAIYYRLDKPQLRQLMLYEKSGQPCGESNRGAWKWQEDYRLTLSITLLRTDSSCEFPKRKVMGCVLNTGPGLLDDLLIFS